MPLTKKRLAPETHPDEPDRAGLKLSRSKRTSFQPPPHADVPQEDSPDKTPPDITLELATGKPDVTNIPRSMEQVEERRSESDSSAGLGSRPRQLLSQFSEVARVLILYTGGTVGMENTPDRGYVPSPGCIYKNISAEKRLNDPASPLHARDDNSSRPSILLETDRGVQSDQITSGPGTGLRLEVKVSPGRRSVPITSRLTSSDNLTTTPDLPTTTSSCSEGDLNTRNHRSSDEPLRIFLPGLVTPQSIYGKRTAYAILEYDPLLDSSDMGMDDWARIAKDIEANYENFDAFVVLHGTDTMAFTASALSFMLEDLGKTVILTGSQIPLSELRNDAIDNILGALTVAGHFVIPEVTLYFNNKLFRGNRTSKVTAVDLNAFDSPNLSPLVNVAISIDVAWQQILRPPPSAHFRVHTNLNPNVAVFRLFPGITESSIRAFLAPPMQGVVMETFGWGNAPTKRKDLIDAIREATLRGVVVVSITQCRKGTVLDLYHTGKALVNAGVVLGRDMTAECALTKLSYLLGKGFPAAEVRKLISRNLRGELTVPPERQRFTVFRTGSKRESLVLPPTHESVDGNVHTNMVGPWHPNGGAVTPGDKGARVSEDVDDGEDFPGIVEQETDGFTNDGFEIRKDDVSRSSETAKDRVMMQAAKALYSIPDFICTAAAAGNITQLQALVSVIMRSTGSLSRDEEISDQFSTMKGNSASQISSMEGLPMPSGMCEASSSITHGIRAFLKCVDRDCRTPLHLAAAHGHYACAEFLLRQGALLHIRDKANHTPLYYAVLGRHREVIKLLREAGGHMASEEVPDIAQQLFSAISGDNIDYVRLLVEEANINLSHVRDDAGRNVLHRAIIAGKPRIVRYLKKHGNVDIDEPTPAGKTCFDLCRLSLGPENVKHEIITILGSKL